MTAEHTAYDEPARDRRGSPHYREGHAEAQRAFLIGRAVRERRLALGLSQIDLAARAGMTQPALSRLEAGGVRPACMRRARGRAGAASARSGPENRP